MNSIDLIDKAILILSMNENLYNRYESEIKLLNQRKEQWQSDKIRIGVIGVTSSGKSTLINAILGNKLLSMAVKPSSSQLVSCRRYKQSMATIFFEDETKKILKWKDLNAKNIKKYSDENINAGNKEHVVQIELSTPTFELGNDILLIDSPGLDAYGLENHEELTLEVLLPTIDICIFVTTLKNNSDEKMKSILNLIGKYKCPVVIVQNMLDSLKPSIDGKKTAEDVALEHRRRVERIIEKSNIEDKESVRIVQMSAIDALKSRCDNSIRDKNQRHIQFQKSNYMNFVKEVKNLVNRERPYIENQRLFTIDNIIKKIISDAKEDINIPVRSNDLKFEYEGLDLQINKFGQEVESNLLKLLNKLDFNYIRPNYSDKDTNGYYNTNYIKRVKDYVKRSEVDIIKNISDFNKYLYSMAAQLNVPPRDIVSFNGLSSMPRLEIRKKTITEKKIREKRGITGKIGRFFGSIFCNDWGYEEITVTKEVVDNLSVEKQVRYYINQAKINYGQEVERWIRKTKIPVNQLLDQIENRREAFEARKEVIIEKESLAIIVKELEELAKLVNIKNISRKNISNINTNRYTSKKLTKEWFSKTSYNIAKLSDKILNNIHININNCLLQREKSINNEWIIVGWDMTSITTFAKRFCSIIFSEIDIRYLEYNAYLEKDKYKFYYKPTKDSNLEFTKKKSNYNLYILTNATQFGAAQNEIFKSGICNNLSENNFLAFVIQDFNELINGDGVKESIKNMLNITNNLNINHKSTILINHENPIYNLALVESQINPNKIEKSETELLNKLQKSFRYLRKEEVDKILAIIIRSTSKKEVL